MSKWNDKVRQIYEKHTGEKWINEQGEPDLDYVEWLENLRKEKICQCSDKASDAVLGEVREALIKLRDFGYDNPGCGYSCAKKADDIINIIRAHIG